MASPRQTLSKNRHNTLWLMNAASLAFAIGVVNQTTKSPVKNIGSSLVPTAEAVDYYWIGTNNGSTSAILYNGTAGIGWNGVWWTGTQTPLGSTNPATANGSTSTAPAQNISDSLYFGTNPGVTGTTFATTISWGSSNATATSLNFLSGAPAYTFTQSSSRVFKIGSSTQAVNAILNNSSSAITFNNLMAPQGGTSNAAAVVFNQANAAGSLVFNGAGSTSYIVNPYAYDYAINSLGYTSSSAQSYATSLGKYSALAIAGRSGTSSSYLKLTGTGTITINGSIDDGYRNNKGSSSSPAGTSGPGHLVIYNTGTTNLNGWNTYTGTTTIGDGTTSGGTVVIGSPYAFGGNRIGDNTAPNAQGSATAYYTGTIASGFSVNTQAFGTVTINSGFSVDLNGQTMIGANPMSMKGYGTGTAPATTGVIRNSSTTAASYAGLISLAASSTMSANYGAITLAGGVNTLFATLSVDGSSNTYITGPITGNSSGGIKKIGTGNLTLSGTNNFAGVLTLISGSVIVTNPNALSSLANLSSSGSVTDTGTLTLTASDAYHMNALSFGGKLIFTTTGGNSTLTFDALSGNAQTGSATGRTLIVNSGVTLNFTGSFDLVGSTSTLPGRYLVIDGAGNVVFNVNSVVQNNATGTALAAGTKGGFNKIGTGTLTFNGANTFDGGITIGGGYVNLGSAEIQGTSGPLGVSGTVTMSGGYLQYSALNQFDYSNRFSTDVSQKYNVDTNGQNVIWGSNLGSVGGSLTKTGLGTLTLSGNNTYDAGTTLAGGSLELGSANALGTTGTISFTGGTLKFTSTNASDYSARFSNAAGQLYNLDTNGQSVAVASALTSVGGTLTKNGNGVLTLSGANTYTGLTTVNQGELAASGSGVFSSNSSVVVQSRATLNLNNTDQSVKGVAGSGTVSLGTANLTINDGDSRSFSGDITGGGNVIKSGSGTQVFSSSLSYAGTTAVNNGTLRVNGTLTASPVSVAGSAVLTGKGNINGQVTVSDNGIITAGDTTLSNASRGALTVSALTFSGSAVINLANVNTDTASSILKAGNISALGAAGSITINITNASQLADNSTFTVLSYTSLDNFSAFTLGTVTGTYNRQIKTLVNDKVNNLITLTTTGDTLKWTGSYSLTPVWTTVTGNANWKLSSSGDPAEYLASDIVKFDDSASLFVVTIGENVSPNGLTFDNSLGNNYAVNSAASTSYGIQGTATLIKNGTGRVDLNAPLSISGGITVNNGTLALNNGGNTFTGNVNLNGAANLELGATGALNTTNSLTFGAGATGKLSLKGNNATLTGLSNDSGNVGTPIIENGSSSINSTLTLNIASGTNTFDGLIQNGSTNALLLTKTGSGILVLTNDNTFTGQTTLTAGTLQLGNGGSTGSVAGDVSIAASTTLNLNRTGKFSTTGIFSGSGALNLKYGQLELLGSNTFTGTATIYSGATLTIGSTGSLSSSATIVDNGIFEYAKSSAYNLGAISGSGDLKLSAGPVTQTGVNSLIGSLTIASGVNYILSSTGSFSSISSITNNGTLTINDHASYTIAAPITGSGNLVANIGALKTLYLTKDNSYQGTTTVSTGTLNVGNGTIAGSLGTGAVTIANGAELILSRLGDTTLSNTITGTGTGKLTIGTSGKLIVTTDNQISLAGELKFGASIGSTTHSTLDLSAASITVGSLRVQTDLGSTGAISPTNNIIIGTGKSLNVNGLVTIGFDNGNNTTTNLTMSGAGTLNIGTLATPTNSNVNVGGSITNSKINYVNWDMTALANLNMYLGAGTFSVGADVNSGGGTGGTGTGVTVKLPTTSTIVATTLLIDAPEPKIFTLSLGAGVNTLNVNTLTIGGNNSRSTDVLNFNSGTGNLVLRDKSGTGRAALNVQSVVSSGSSSNTLTGNFDLSNHTADLYLSSVVVGRRDTLTSTSPGGGNGIGYLAFTDGVFDALDLKVATKSHNGTQAASALDGKTSSSHVSGNVVGLVSFGGGTVTLGTVDLARHGASYLAGNAEGLIEFLGSNTSTVGAVTMATASTTTTGTATVTGTINIADGNVSIASINGASAAANTSATANINLSGGTLTMGGNISKVGGLGTSAFNLNLSGGTLDMAGHEIGATGVGSNVTLNWTKGTLKNVSGLNGTDGITVNTGDQFTPVYLGGTNTFSSKITIKDSILQLQSTSALAANSKIGFDGTLGVLQLGSGVSTDVSGNLSNGNAQFDTNGNNVTFNNSVSGLTSFTKMGPGKLTLNSTGGSLAPIVKILGGSLELGNGNSSIPAGGFLNGTSALTLDAMGGSPELIANGVSVDLNADVNLLNSGATISGSKGTSAYSFNFKKDIISQNSSTATISATDMITGASSHISVGSGATLTISGSFIDGATATQITKNGTGTLEFTGTGNTYSGATTVNAGLLSISQGALSGSSTTITVNNGANLTAVDLGTNVSLNVATGGAADLTGTALEVKALSGAGSVVLSGNTPTLTVGSGTFVGNLSSTDTASLVKTGNGTLTLGGTNTLTGPVTLNGGIVSVSDFTALGAATDAPANLIIQGGKLQYTGTAPATLTRGFTVGNGGAGFISSGTGALTIQGNMDFADTSASNRTLSLGGTTDIAVRNIFNPTKIDEADVTNLFKKLVKQETNKWIVLGAGAGFVDDAQTEIDIQNGELGFAMGALGSKSTITMDGTGGATATLGWESGNTEDVSGRVNLRAASSAAFDIPTDNTVTFASALNGGASSSASVTKMGGGTLNLNAPNTFTGGFTISGGTVKAGVSGALGSGSVTVNANSTLVVNAILANTVTIKSSGTLTSDQTNQDIDDATVEEDGILVPGGNAIGTMTAHNLTLKGGSVVNWQISNALGAANNIYTLAGSGYDTFILNSLALTDASLSKRVHIQVKNIFGEKASNFDKANVQKFKFAKLTNKLSLVDAAHVTDLFEIDASQFEYVDGLKTDHLVWYMTVSADREYLYVVAVPEPSTYGLGLGALALAFAAVRRRKQKKNLPVA